MSISKDTIIAPGQAAPGIPLKKATVLGVIVIVLAMAAVGAIWSDSRSGQSTSVAEKNDKDKKNEQDLREQRGKAGTKQIEAEASEAADRVKRDQSAAAQRAAAASSANGAQAPLPGPVAAGELVGIASSGSDAVRAPGGSLGASGQRFPNRAGGASGIGQAPARGVSDVGPLGAAGAGSVRSDMSAEAEVVTAKAVVFDDSRADNAGGLGLGKASQGQSATAEDVLRKRYGLDAPAPAAQKVAQADFGSGANAALEAIYAQQAAATRAAKMAVPGGIDRAWLQEYADEPRKTKALRSYPVSSRFVLMQGKVIPAVLGRDLNSDLPGEITAYTTMDVYDSIDGNLLLIPKSSTLVGRYSNGVRAGQERLMFAFNRLILPDGRSFDLEGNTGIDQSGAAGIAGDVNNHFFKMFSTSFLVAFLANKTTPSSATTVVNGGGSTGGVMTAAGQVLADVSKAVLDRYKSIPPTITVPKGSRINVEVTRDLDFPGVYRNGVYQ